MTFLIGLCLVTVSPAQTSAEAKDFQSTVVEWVAEGVELLAVTVVVLGIGYSTILYASRLIRRTSPALAAYEIYKRQIGRTLLLALELLVASDILITVVFKPSLEHVAILGALVLIRTFLSWSLGVEIEGRWPWQRRPSTGPEDEADEPCGMS